MRTHAIVAALVSVAAANQYHAHHYQNSTTSSYPSPSVTYSPCEQVYNHCVAAGNGSPNLADCAASSAACSGTISPTKGYPVTTKVVTSFETYCPEPTTLTYNSKTYTVTKATTLTITDCPCTITHKPTTPVETHKPESTTKVITKTKEFTTKVVTTKVVTSFETYCPAPTTLTYNSKTYTVTEKGTLTVTDCPCTITKPVETVVETHPAPPVETVTKPAPTVETHPAPPVETVTKPAPPIETKPAPPVETHAPPPAGTPISQIPDGQIQNPAPTSAAPPAGTPISQIPDGQIQNPVPTSPAAAATTPISFEGAGSRVGPAMGLLLVGALALL